MIRTGKDIWSVKVSLNKTEFMVWTKGYVNCHSALMKTKGPQAPSEGRHLDSVTALSVLLHPGTNSKKFIFYLVH